MKIKKVIFLGGNRFNESGPMTSFIEVCKKRNIESMVLSNSSRLDYPVNSEQSLREFLQDININFIEDNDVTLDLLKEHIDDGTIIFSVNCEVIIKANLINFMRNKIFNYHNASLPTQKGASSHSWRIMQDNKLSHLSIHHLTEEVDSGEIVLEREVIFPDSVKNLKETYEYIEKEEINLFDDFVNILEDGLSKKVKPANNSKSFYWPRLNTDIDGFISWHWSAKQIVDFCNAFDEPFDGASSYIKGSRVRFKNVQTDDEDIYFHPYQFGLVYRKKENSIWIACKDGGIKVNDVTKEEGITIKLGDRFTSSSS
tara:strand:+ start:601 stop:1539 length:939 start_codon:yes stop_codon:yes gene_type:complete